MNNKEIYFTRIDLSENGIVLRLQSKEELEIFMPELKKIYIAVYAISIFQKFLIFLFFGVFFVLVSIYLSLDMFLLICSLVSVLLLMKIIDYRSYTLFVLLQNGTAYKQKIPLKYKFEAIDTVYKVRRKIYCYKVQKGDLVCD